MVAEWAARLLDVAAELDAGIAALRQDRHSRLRVSASLTVAEALLPGCLVAFRARRPGGRARPAAEIVLTAANSDAVLAQVSDGRADLGFVEGPNVPRSLRSKTVGHDRLVLVVPPGASVGPPPRRHPGRAGRHAAGQPGGGLGHQGGAGRGAGPRAGAGRAPGPGSRCRCPPPRPSGPPCWPARPRRVLSRLSVGDDLAAGRLVEVGVTGLDLRRPLRAVWRGSASPRPGRHGT